MTATLIDTGALSLTVTREALRDAVSALAPAINARTSLPVLKCLRLEARDGQLALAATDLDLWVSLSIPADVREPGIAMLPAERLARIVKELPPEPVTLATDTKHQTKLKCGKVRATILGMPPDESPDLPAELSDGRATSCRLTVKDLHVLAERTTFAAAGQTHGGREAIKGVLCELRGDRLRLVATDGHRMAIADTPVTGTDLGDVIVPPVAFGHIFRLFADDEVVEISRSEQLLAFRSESASVVTRMVEGPYPDYDRVVPKDNPRLAVLDRQALLSAVRRMVPMAEEKNAKAKLQFSATTLRMRSERQDAGTIDDELSCALTGEEISIGVNASYMAEVLRHIPGTEVQLEMRTPESAIVLRPQGSSEAGAFVGLLMPLRLVD